MCGIKEKDLKLHDVFRNLNICLCGWAVESGDVFLQDMRIEKKIRTVSRSLTKKSLFCLVFTERL